MQFIFTDPETNSQKVIPKEKWCWVAHYLDGTKLEQFDANGIFHQFREIYQPNIASFEMVCENGQSINLQVPLGADLIHYYRNQVLNLGTPQQQKIRFYMFGWKIKIEGRLHKQIIQIFPDNSIRLLDDDGRPD